MYNGSSLMKEVKMTKNELLNLVGQFYWAWGHKWFIETEKGNFVWSDPDYPGGTDEIVPFGGTLADFAEMFHVEYVRCKGPHLISTYCGNTFKLNDQ